MKNVIRAIGLQFMAFIRYPDIEIPEREMTFICGESGSGKTTLLKLFNATQSPSAGSIYYRDEDIDAWDTVKLRRKVLLASQEAYLFNGTIKENFDIFYDSRDEQIIDEAHMRDMLSLCCVDFPLDTQCAVLSGGEKQRVFLAICLSFSPDILLLDEPTSALDEKTAHLLLTQIKEYARDRAMTSVVVCHDNNLVNAFADQIIYLTKGE